MKNDSVESETYGLRIIQDHNKSNAHLYCFSAPAVLYDHNYNYKDKTICECSSLNQKYNNKHKFCIHRHVAMHNYIYFKNRMNESYIHKDMYTYNDTETDSQSITTINSHILQNYTSMYDSESNKSNSTDDATQFMLDDDNNDNDPDDFEELNFTYQTFLNVAIQLEKQNYSDAQRN